MALLVCRIYVHVKYVFVYQQVCTKSLRRGRVCSYDMLSRVIAARETRLTDNVIPPEIFDHTFDESADIHVSIS